VVVTSGGVEVDGDLDNRACITDRQEDRKERKDSRTRQEKKLWLTIEKKIHQCVFFYVPTFDHILRTVHTEQCATANRR